MADEQEATANEDRPLIYEDQRNEAEQRSQRSIDESLLSSADQRPKATTRNLVVLCILFVELCERLTFYGVAANLVFYCSDVLKLPSPLPSTITLAFQGEIMCIVRNNDRLGTACPGYYFFFTKRLLNTPGGGGGLLPNITYTGFCRPPGSGF